MVWPTNNNQRPSKTTFVEKDNFANSHATVVVDELQWGYIYLHNNPMMRYPTFL